MDVTDDNFAQQLPQILNTVQNASFVAFDLEFLGFHGDDEANRPSLFDSPVERYRKQRLSVLKFPPVQWGLALFTAIDDGRHYKVDVYNIYLFKRTINRRVFSFSIPSIAFLGEHDFDFNKAINKGVTYANLDEISTIRSDLEEGLLDYDIFGERFNSHLISVQCYLSDMLERLRKAASPPTISMYQEVTFSPFVLNLDDAIFDPYACRSEAQPLNHRKFCATRLQAAARLFSLHSNTHHVKLKVDGHRLHVQQAKPNERRVKNERAKLLNKTVNEIAGASQILYAIIDARLPVVGHNCLFDLLYIYQYFFADLPEDYAKWKKALNTIFPVIIDTRILAEENKRRLSWHGVMNYSLVTLGAYFKHPVSSENLPYRFPDFSLTNAALIKYADKEYFHNAAYDAKTTGETFVRLAHLTVCNTLSLGDKPKEVKACRPFRVLLYAVRPFANRIPVPLMGVPFINLVGDDPPSTRPKAIMLEGVGASGRRLFPFAYPRLSMIDLAALRREVNALFGHWRCDLQAIDGGRRVLLATNTGHTYNRVYNYYSCHASYKIVSEVDFLTRGTPSLFTRMYGLFSKALLLHKVQCFFESLIYLKWSLGVCSCAILAHCFMRYFTSLR
uniref:Poly(A)-specific ribonuclease PARN n=1 Tax=Ascaris suum TaxID=6253 RepID=F1KYZ0_ASCSU